MAGVPYANYSPPRYQYVDANCEGDWFTLRRLVGGGPERLKLRSVVFS
ncbi:hypothetical protein ABZO31_32500 [Streptomyces sp. HUAS MG47]